MSEERRTGIRLAVNDEFSSIDVHLSEYVANLSEGGIFLRCDEKIPLGTEVSLQFTVLADNFETIEGSGEVVHHGYGGAVGLGIRFTNLSDKSRAIIEQLCASAQHED